MKTLVYINMAPYGILKLKSGRLNIVKEKAKFLRGKGFNSEMIKGYLLAQGHSKQEIYGNL